MVVLAQQRPKFLKDFCYLYTKNWRGHQRMVSGNPARRILPPKVVAVDNRNLYLVAPEDLILSKLEWAKESRSEMQLSDVRNLLKSVRQLNRRYLVRWAGRYTSILMLSSHGTRSRVL